jgi:hypothetical protein
VGRDVGQRPEGEAARPNALSPFVDVQHLLPEGLRKGVAREVERQRRDAALLRTVPLSFLDPLLPPDADGRSG